MEDEINLPDFRPDEEVAEHGNFIRELRDAVDAVAPIEAFQNMLEAAPAWSDLTQEQHSDLLNLMVNDLISEDESHLEIIQVLISHFPPALRVPDHEGQLPLHYPFRLLNPPEEIIKALLDGYPEGAEWVTQDGDQALHLACDSQSSFEIVQRLVELHPEAVRRKSSQGMLPLHHALVFSHEAAEIVKLLIKEYPGGAQVQDERGGRFPLHYAAFDAPLEVFQLVMEAYSGAVRAIDNGGSLPLHISCSAARFYGTKLLIKQYPDGAKVQDVQGHFPLHCAALFSTSSEMLQLLIEAYPDAIRVQDNLEKLPLHYACEGGSSQEAVQLLIERYSGEETNSNGLRVVDSNGLTPLHYAANGRVEAETLQLLLESYPQGVNIATRIGMLPLHIASQHSGIEHVHHLVDMDLFTVLQKTDDGRTALQLASQSRWTWRNDFFEVKGFLLEKQNEAIAAVKETFVTVATEELGLPDLVIALVWSFARPDLWQPPE